MASSAGNWQLIRKDATSSVKVDLGSTAARNTTHVFDLVISAAPNASQVTVFLKNLSTGQVVLDNVAYSTSLPTSSAFLFAHAEIGPAAAGVAAQLEIAGLSLVEERGTSLGNPWLDRLGSVDSVATLQRLVGTFNSGDQVDLAGYYLPGDGGGGSLFFESTPPSAATITNATLSLATISGTTGAGVAIEITVTAHPFSTGQSVLISGVLGNTAANGTWLITKKDANTIILQGSTGNGTWSSGGTQQATSVIVSTSPNPHGLLSPWPIMLAGVRGMSGINGMWPAIGVLTTTTFSLAASAAAGAGTYSGGGLLGDGGLSIPSAALNARWLREKTLPYNPKFFGARWDGVHDDTTAWNALMAAVPYNGGAGVPSSGTEIALPEGLGYFAGDVNIKRSVRIEGQSGGANSTALSGFKLTPLSRIVFHSSYTSDDGGLAPYSSMAHFDVRSKTAIVMTATFGSIYGGLSQGTDTRIASTYVEKGTCVIYSGATAGANPTVAGSGAHNDVMFRCIAGGTPTGSEPASFATATTASIGQLVADTSVEGTLAWKVESVPKDWQANTVYTIGQRVLIPGDTRFVFEVASVTGDQKTGSAYPGLFSQPPFEALIPDNHVTWKVLVPCNILLMCGSIKISHFLTVGGIGYSVMLEGSPLDAGGTRPVLADFCDVIDGNIFYAGGGYHSHGSDSNGGQTERLRFYGMANAQRSSSGGPSGRGEVLIWNRGEGIAYHQNHYSQFTSSPAYVNDTSAGLAPAGQYNTTGGGDARYSALWAENTLPDLFYGAALILGESSIQSASTDSTAMQFSEAGSRNVRFVSTLGANAGPVLSPIPYINSFYEIKIHGQANGYSWWDSQVNGLSIGTGWLARGMGPYTPGDLLARVIYGESHVGASNVGGGPGPGMGLFRIYDGFVAGRTNSLVYEGVDTAMLGSSRLRYGLRLVGDSFRVLDGTDSIGMYRKIVCTQQGYRGVPWTGTLTYYGESPAPYLGEAILVEPSSAPKLYSDGTTRVWKFAGSTVISGGLEPSWPPGGGNFTDTLGNLWIDMGPTAIFQPADPIHDHIRIAVQAMANANQTLSLGTFRPIIQTTGALTAARTLTLPSTADFAGAERILDNRCTGAFAVKVAPATGDLSTNGVANGKVATIYFDGTNWRRVSPDVTP